MAIKLLRRDESTSPDWLARFEREAGYRRLAQKPTALSDRDSILIGTFENPTGEAVFDETLATALQVHLGQSPIPDIVPDQRIRETLACPITGQRDIVATLYALI